MFWSVVVKRFNALHSREGLSYLLSFGHITEAEYTSLIEAGSNNLGANHASIAWLTTRIRVAQKRGDIEVDHAAMVVILDKITNLRMLMARIPGKCI